MEEKLGLSAKLWDTKGGLAFLGFLKECCGVKVHGISWTNRKSPAQCQSCFS